MDPVQRVAATQSALHVASAGDLSDHAGAQPATIAPAKPHTKLLGTAVPHAPGAARPAEPGHERGEPGPMNPTRYRAALQRLAEDARENASAGLRAHVAVAAWLAGHYERNLRLLAPQLPLALPNSYENVIATAEWFYSPHRLASSLEEPHRDSVFARAPHAPEGLASLREALDAVDTVLESLREPSDVIAADLASVLRTLNDEFLYPLRMEPIPLADFLPQVRPDVRKRLLELDR